MVRRRLSLEIMESRCCLSAMAFVEHDGPTIGNGGAMDAGDLDGDGDLDLVVSNASDVVWLENTDGQGEYREALRMPNPTAFDWIRLADVDGDNGLDVITGGYGFDDERNSLVWYQNRDGRGTLAPAAAISEEQFDSAIVVDMNGDRIPDVLAGLHSFFADPEDSAIWYRNQGDGTFDVGQSFGDQATSNPYLADLDADGDQDIVAFGFKSIPVVWYENLGDRFADASNPVMDLNDIFHYSIFAIRAADFDTDGDNDVVVFAPFPFGARIELAENLGGGVFSQHETLELRGLADMMGDTADLDCDGDLDLLWMLHEGTEAVWYENTGATLEFVSRGPAITTSSPMVDCQTGDFDGDGRVDLACLQNDPSSEGSLVFHWYENRLIGDANDDGVFDSSDMVRVFVGGKYEDDIPGNATYDEGDWNQDGDFDSSDLVIAFQTGLYEARSEPDDSGLAAAMDWLFAEDDRTARRSAYIA